MLHPATIEIYEKLSNNTKLKVFTEEVDHTSCVWLKFGAENGSDYTIRFISTDDKNDVAVRVFALATVPEDRSDRMLRTLNELNVRFRFVKFVLDKKNHVHMEYDFTVNTASVADSAEEIVIRIVSILKEAYPEIMRALWA